MDTPATEDSGSTASPRKHEIKLLLRYAQFIAWPIANFHPTHLQEIDTALAELAAQKHFSRPLELAAYEALGADRLTLDEEAMAAIATRRDAQIALLATTASSDDFALASNFLAAAILHRHLSALLARADRERAIAELGALPFQLGIREAHALYGALAELAPPAPPAADSGEEKPLTAFGTGWLYRFVSETVPGLGPIFALRLPRDAVPPAGAFAPAQLVLATTLLRRKIPGWLECTV